MNKAKGIFWLIVLGFIALLIFQNQDFFLGEASLQVNLGFVQYETRDLPSAVFFLSFFVAGLLIAYFFGLYTKYKSNQIIKDLNNKIKGHQDVIARMGEEVSALKADAEERARQTRIQEPEPVESETDSDEAQGLVEESEKASGEGDAAG